MSKNKKVKGEVPKPRATEVNRILRDKVGGAHEPKSGEQAKRARQKEEVRKLIETSQ
jgi:hypothetical protein